MKHKCRNKNKQLHKEIYERCHRNYEYNSDYHPLNEICFDNNLDKALYYGTIYPNHDKNDYTAYPMRGYKKKGDDK